MRANIISEADVKNVFSMVQETQQQKVAMGLVDWPKCATRHLFFV